MCECKCTGSSWVAKRSIQTLWYAADLFSDSCTVISVYVLLHLHQSESWTVRRRACALLHMHAWHSAVPHVSSLCSTFDSSTNFSLEESYQNGCTMSPFTNHSLSPVYQLTSGYRLSEQYPKRWSWYVGRKKPWPEKVLELTWPV